MAIERMTPVQHGAEMTSVWFIPDTMDGVDHEVIQSIAEMGWAHTARCDRPQKWPGGRFVEVSTLAGMNADPVLALELHNAFADCVNFVLGEWERARFDSSNDVFATRERIQAEVKRRWIVDGVVSRALARR